MKSLNKKGEALNKNTRLMVYAFLTLNESFLKITKLSKKERESALQIKNYQPFRRDPFKKYETREDSEDKRIPSEQRDEDDL